MKKLLPLILFAAVPIFALPEGSEEFLVNANKVAPMAYAPEPDAPVVYNAKFGQFSFRTSEKKSYTLNVYEVFGPTSAAIKETQRENVSYYLMVVDPEERKIYRGSPKTAPELVNPFEELTEENLIFYRKR